MITERTEVSAQAACATDAPSRAGLPPWLLWGGMIGLAQIFAIATVQPLGVSTAYPQLVATWWTSLRLALPSRSRTCKNRRENWLGVC